MRRRLPARSRCRVPVRRHRFQPGRGAGAAPSSDDVFTYSVSFGAAYPNELPFSSLVAEHCGTRHQVVELSPDAF